MNSWLVLAQGEARQHAGNEGYPDEPSSAYRWDSEVYRHDQVDVGDRIVVRDADSLLGASIVLGIDTRSGTKLRRRCHECERTTLKKRVTKSPRFRCHNCQLETDRPLIEEVPVVEYSSQHGEDWIDMQDLASRQELAEVCENPESQHSIRPLDWDAFEELIESRAPGLLEGVHERVGNQQQPRRWIAKSAQPEAVNVVEFSSTGTRNQTRERREAELVRRWREWVDIPVVTRIYERQGQRPKRTDAFVPDWNLLVEAKSGVTWSHLWTAIGELHEYLWRERSATETDLGETPTIAVLLPLHPGEEKYEWLLAEGVTVMWESEDGVFESSSSDRPVGATWR